MIKRGLGRGLGALIPGAAADGEGGPASDLEVGLLAPNPFQPRRAIDGAEFDELVASVRRHGILQPIIVRRASSGYEIVMGERRWRAAQAAGLTRIPAVVRAVTDREMLELALIENLRREDLSPIERANAYRRLGEEFQLTQEQIAQVVGGSRPSIANTLRLLELPAEVQAAIAQGRLTEGHGRTLLGLADSRLIATVWRQVEERGLSVRETEALVKSRSRRVSRETSAHPGSRKDPLLSDLEAQVRERYATSVKIIPNGKKGTIQFHYYSQDDLERLLDLLLR